MTYGACCVDDFSALALKADLLVHYAHSCLVPVDVTTIPCLYIFVDIKIDVQHFVDSVKCAHPPCDMLATASDVNSNLLSGP